jgi:hypothetical protein
VLKLHEFAIIVPEFATSSTAGAGKKKKKHNKSREDA